jgi:HEAT repeat protein
MKQSMRVSLIVPALLVVCPMMAAAQPLAFEDVVRNLRNPDPELRMSAVRLLRDAKYPEALAPMVPLVNDPLNEIQLEAIATELAFFLVEDIPARRKVAFVIEKRADGQAERAFEMGPLVAWPKHAPAELVTALLKAVDDEDAKVRQEAIYTLGVIGAGAIDAEHAKLLVTALDHYDPAIRTGAARVIGRLRVKSAGEGLIKAMNDSNAQVRNASMRALGEVGEQSAVQALTDQFNYYGKGEGAWSALDALARIAHPSSVPLFKEKLTDRDPWLRRASAEGLARVKEMTAAETLRAGAGMDESEMVRAAMAFGLTRLGQDQVVRLVDFMDSTKATPQVQGYLMELGPSIIPDLVPRLQEPDEAVRRSVVEVMGALGDESTVAPLTPLLQDRNKDVVKAATHAIKRIGMRAE